MTVFLVILFKLILAIVATEAITEIVVKSELFFPLRKWLYNRENPILKFIHQVLDCGYCFSVWAAMLVTLCLFVMDNNVTYTIIVILFVHRFSNLFHFLVDKVRND